MKAITLLLMLVCATPALAQTRDARGRITGTVSTDANGQQTYRDGAGRMTGTSTFDANKTRTFRDASGRITGTEELKRR